MPHVSGAGSLGRSAAGARRQIRRQIAYESKSQSHSIWLLRFLRRLHSLLSRFCSLDGAAAWFLAFSGYSDSCYPGCWPAVAKCQAAASPMATESDAPDVATQVSG